MAGLEKTASVLSAIGALNWGLYALSPQAELVQYLSISWLIVLVYALIGLSGLWMLVKIFK